MADDLGSAAFRRSGYRVEVFLDDFAPGWHELRLRVVLRENGDYVEGAPLRFFVVPAVTRFSEYRPPVASVCAPGAIAVAQQGNCEWDVEQCNDVAAPFRSQPVYLSLADHIAMSGWAADTSAGKTAYGVEIVSGGLFFSARYGSLRKDVADALGRPAYLACGFSAKIPCSVLGAGRRAARVRVILASGDRYFESEPLLIAIQPEGEARGVTGISICPPDAVPVEAGRCRYSLERCNEIMSPVGRFPISVAVSGNIKLVGWAVDLQAGSIADAVEISIDGKYYAARYRIPRGDVADALGKPNCLLSGFIAEIPCALLGLGKHAARIRIVLSSGGRYIESEPLEILVKPDAAEAGREECRCHIESCNEVADPLRCGAVSLAASETIKLVGWAIDIGAGTSVRAVDVAIGAITYPAQYGIARADVANHYGNGDYLYSGFVAEVPAAELGAGTHELRVRVLPNSGERYTESGPVRVIVYPEAAGVNAASD